MNAAGFQAPDIAAVVHAQPNVCFCRSAKWRLGGSSVPAGGGERSDKSRVGRLLGCCAGWIEPIRLLPIGPLIAEAIARTAAEESVSSLFD